MRTKSVGQVGSGNPYTKVHLDQVCCNATVFDIHLCMQGKGQ
jgi:hypothetical protein